MLLSFAYALTGLELTLCNHRAMPCAIAFAPLGRLKTIFSQISLSLLKVTISKN